MKGEPLCLKQKLSCAFDHPFCSFLNLFQIYYILSERKGPGLLTLSKVWLQHGFVWCKYNKHSFWFGLYSFISGSEFLTLGLLIFDHCEELR